MPTTTPHTWHTVIGNEKHAPYFQRALAHVQQRRQAGITVYPPQKEVFNAFTLTPFSDVKVIIIGQDPYHQPGQAHGLCFSVKPGIAPPPSLNNIYKAMQQDLHCPPPQDGSLIHWAQQGVFLLNAVLTVEAGRPQSHANIGWETFTNQVIRALSAQRRGLVFLLWGGYAQKKRPLIDATQHSVLTAPHPSPLSAHRGFFDCAHFSKTNTRLQSQGKTPIQWSSRPIASAERLQAVQPCLAD